MKIVCVKCKREIGEKTPLSDNRTTHTLCYRCLKKFRERQLAKNKKRLKKRLRKGQLRKSDPEVTSTSGK